MADADAHFYIFLCMSFCAAHCVGMITRFSDVASVRTPIEDISLGL